MPGPDPDSQEAEQTKGCRGRAAAHIDILWLLNLGAAQSCLD